MGTQGSFWKLLIGTVVMLCSATQERLTCALAVPGWASLPACADGSSSSSRSSVVRLDLLQELGSANKFTQASFGTMRLIVTAGWSIYPAGYFFGYLMGGVNDCSLDLIYNLADFVNKIAFCLAIWQAAKNESLGA